MTTAPPAEPRRRQPKDWNKIVRELSDPEDSDDGDELNEVMVRKNAQKLADVMHHYLPGLDASEAQSVPATTALGTAFLRQQILKAASNDLVGVHVDEGGEEGEDDRKEDLGEKPVVTPHGGVKE